MNIPSHDKSISENTLSQIRRDNVTIIELPFPGFSPKNVSIDLKDDILEILGHRETLDKELDRLYFVKKLNKGEYIRADWSYGMLTIHIMTA